MFRRREDEIAQKEDSLFGAAEGASVVESAAAATPSAQSAAAAPASGFGTSPASGFGAAAAASQPSHAAAAPASRPQTASASAFRPNNPASPIGGDLARNRMPEAKPASAPSAGSAIINAASADKSKMARRVLTVGNDILLKGEIATCDRLVIEGKVDASLNDVHTVEIAENGSFRGSAQIEDAEISGLFEGDLVVRNRLIIYATGKVRGKITYGEIEIERGGELTGEIKTIAQAGTGAARPSRMTGNKEQKFEAA